MHPSLFQINTRTMMRQLRDEMGSAGTLDDISDEFLDRLQERRFDWVWLLGVWRTGDAGRQISRSNETWQTEFRELIPDIQEPDICGSCFAITGYEVDEAIGGVKALKRFRKRLLKRDLRLMLDFVPNHTAKDHPWVTTHPEYYVAGTEENLAAAPHNYERIRIADRDAVLAYGRDPYFAGWPDTFQLNYGEPELQKRMIHTLMAISQLCDGVRCDMAMLLLPDVFERTWGIASQPFWPQAIECTRKAHPGFVFMAEVYWDLEWTLQQQGFDYTYDKRLYDRLAEQHVRPVRDHLRADLEFQTRSARFLENHDEPRAAGVFPKSVHFAAAVISFLSPGLRFFHQGQFEGFQKRIPVHLSRGPSESVDAEIAGFYERLNRVIALDVVRTGDWSLLHCDAAWDGNWTSDCFICFSWQDADRRLVVVVNYAANQSQGYVRLPFADIAGKQTRLRDLMSSEIYERSGDDLVNRGLYLDVPAWAYHVFDVSCI